MTPMVPSHNSTRLPRLFTKSASAITFAGIPQLRARSMVDPLELWPNDIFKPRSVVTLENRRFKLVTCVSPVGDGMSGQVWRVEEVVQSRRTPKSGASGSLLSLPKVGSLAPRTFAAKFFTNPEVLNWSRGSQYPVWKIEDFHQQEINILSAISHPHVVRMFFGAMYDPSTDAKKSGGSAARRRIPYILSEFVEGDNLFDWLAKRRQGTSSDCVTPGQLVELLLKIVSALDYLHDQKILHLDVKAANIRVRNDHQPILVDFGLGKVLKGHEVVFQLNAGLLSLLSNFDPALERLFWDERNPEALARAFLPGLDLYLFGKMLQEIKEFWPILGNDRDEAYLEELASRLTTWDQVKKWRIGHLRKELERLIPGRFWIGGVPELGGSTSTERTLVLPIGSGVPVTAAIEKLIDTRSFRRMAHINQLSLLHLVYPGATCTRSVHMLHTYDLGRQFLVHLYANPTFLTLFPPESARQLLASCLLHDINHYPLLHVLEETGIPQFADRAENADFFCDGLATRETENGKKSIYDILKEEFGLDRDRFKRLAFGQHSEQVGDSKESDRVMSSILRSGVDVDKLSYLQLDAFYSGVRYGSGIDMSCILKGATICDLGNGRGHHLAFTDRAVQALEHVVMARFWNFRSLYWHHTNRSAMAMVLHVARILYLGLGGRTHFDPRQYLNETMWYSDMEAVKYLHQKFTLTYSRPSILDGIWEDRTRLYRRLYTVRPRRFEDERQSLFGENAKVSALGKLEHTAVRSTSPDEVDADTLIYNWAQGIAAKDTSSGFIEERRAMKSLAARLSKLIGEEVSDQEVLVDVPRKPLDWGGEVWIWSHGQPPKKLSEISEPVRTLVRNYDELTRRVRFFVSPRIRAEVEKGVTGVRSRGRPTIQRLILETLAES